MKRSVPVLPVLAAATLLTVAGCATEEPGIADPQTSSSAASSTSTNGSPNQPGGISASIDPCALITPAEDLTEYGRFSTGPASNDEAPGETSCSWQKEREDPLDESLIVGLIVRANQSVGTVNDVGGGVTDGEINGRTAAEAPNPQFHDCTLAIELDADSRIDVLVTAMDDVNAACEVAREVAYLVEPRLPKA
ncbi:DUF3558 domain-containing protein [Saccharomonospora azurea]|uniref:DUF3558 domain-containing protein n=1 Tax=Saccharomonospora azurea NA-128 TaxID=882081 RepID=H8G9Q1_9PSEU|nr:DUF3558 domain-containing protein [Saccharomonospora azurea]EHY90554.1 Protein of unknown function (DUF3558) [Saccharomonospora azurea NA-128]